MTKLSRKKYSGEFKAKVAIEALKEQKTLPELAALYEIHPTQILQWKKRFMENAAMAFEDNKSSTASNEALEAQLYEQIGKLQMANDWLKKKLL